MGQRIFFFSYCLFGTVFHELYTQLLAKLSSNYSSFLRHVCLRMEPWSASIKRKTCLELIIDQGQETYCKLTNITVTIKSWKLVRLMCGHYNKK